MRIRKEHMHNLSAYIVLALFKFKRRRNKKPKNDEKRQKTNKINGKDRPSTSEAEME